MITPVVKRLFWLTVGYLALALAVVGVVLPLLPTTPFILLATFSFAKSVPFLETWLLRHSVFGPIIDDWQKNRAIARRYKVLALAMMLAAFALSYLYAMATFVLVTQAICMTAAAVFILTRSS